MIHIAKDASGQHAYSPATLKRMLTTRSPQPERNTNTQPATYPIMCCSEPSTHFASASLPSTYHTLVPICSICHIYSHINSIHHLPLYHRTRQTPTLNLCVTYLTHSLDYHMCLTRTANYTFYYTLRLLLQLSCFVCTWFHAATPWSAKTRPATKGHFCRLPKSI